MISEILILFLVIIAVAAIIKIVGWPTKGQAGKHSDSGSTGSSPTVEINIDTSASSPRSKCENNSHGSSSDGGDGGGSD